MIIIFIINVKGSYNYTNHVLKSSFNWIQKDDLLYTVKGFVSTPALAAMGDLPLYDVGYKKRITAPIVSAKVNMNGIFLYVNNSPK